MTLQQGHRYRLTVIAGRLRHQGQRHDYLVWAGGRYRVIHCDDELALALSSYGPLTAKAIKTHIGEAWRIVPHPPETCIVSVRADGIRVSRSRVSVIPADWQEQANDFTSTY